MTTAPSACDGWSFDQLSLEINPSGCSRLDAELEQSAIGPKHRALLHYRRVSRQEAQQLKGYSPARWDVEACCLLIHYPGMQALAEVCPGDRLPVVISARTGK